LRQLSEQALYSRGFFATASCIYYTVSGVKKSYDGRH
jgi:hypothetical protein